MGASSSMTLPARDPGRIVAAAVSPAFEGLFRAEYARVVGIAHRVLADQAEAEDVAQDVFLSFYRAHPADAPYAPAWLHAAAAHSALNALRSRDRRSRREASQAVPLETPATDDPADLVAASETRDEVRAVLARLPERSAAMLALRYAGLSYEEIAQALDVRASSIGTLLRRAEERGRGTPDAGRPQLPRSGLRGPEPPGVHGRVRHVRVDRAAATEGSPVAWPGIGRRGFRRAGSDLAAVERHREPALRRDQPLYRDVHLQRRFHAAGRRPPEPHRAAAT